MIILQSVLQLWHRKYPLEHGTILTDFLVKNEGKHILFFVLLYNYNTKKEITFNFMVKYPCFDLTLREKDKLFSNH
jgi:hypothetical protein